MSILSDALLPKDIHLQLKATDPRDALEEIIASFRSDRRVKDWEKLRAALIANTAKEISKGCSEKMTLHHARTESVSTLILAAGRNNERLVFVALIPEAMNNEYLRILGAIARVCREEGPLKELLSVQDQDTFLNLLEKGCRQ